MNFDDFKNETYLVVGNEEPVINEDYNCSILIMKKDGNIKMVPITIPHVTMCLKRTSQIFQIYSDKYHYIVLLSKAPKCEAVKIITCDSIPRIGEKLICKLLTKIEKKANDFTHIWEDHKTDEIIRRDTSSSIPLLITNNTTYYCLMNNPQNLDAILYDSSIE